MRILGLLFGIILLLPGVCSLGFMAALLPDLGKPSGLSDLAPLSLLWAFCFLVSFGGIMLIRNALRSPPPGS